ncbi:MAG: FmdB family zinc ribbon protein [Gaiellales bacterium]
MPTYEYRCAEGHETEVFAKMTDPPLKKCPECGKKVERVLFAPPIHYKGSGYYSTDYGKGGKRATKEKADTGESKSSDSSYSNMSDSSSATTSKSTSDSGSKPKPSSD